MRTQAMSKPRGEGPSPPFSIAPKSFPEGSLVIMPVLGHLSLEESYLSLAKGSCTGGQAGWSKVGRSRAPAREISFVSLVTDGPKVSHSALATGFYSFWNQAGWFPTTNYNVFSMKYFRDLWNIISIAYISNISEFQILLYFLQTFF